MRMLRFRKFQFLAQSHKLLSGGAWCSIPRCFASKLMNPLLLRSPLVDFHLTWPAFLYQLVVFGKIFHCFLLLPHRDHFPFLNVDFCRPEEQNKSRNRSQLAATGLTSHDFLVQHLEYILQAGELEGFWTCINLPPTQISPQVIKSHPCEGADKTPLLLPQWVIYHLENLFGWHIPQGWYFTWGETGTKTWMGRLRWDRT